tara:strand:+ start:226 stop:408 length:183 start_codon:yes stop_codon:yes gene_type:complete
VLEHGVFVDSGVNKKNVVAVTMATSRQGAGVVKELNKTDDYKIRAITRNIKRKKLLNFKV